MGLPEELQGGHRAVCFTGPASQSELRPFSGPGQDPGPLPNAHTFLAFLQSLSSCCRAFFPVLIYSLLFLKYTQRPWHQAPAQHRAQAPSTHQPGSQESGPSLLEGWTPGSDPPTRKGDPRSHLPPAYGPRTDLRADYKGWMSGEEETLGRSQGGLS